jgi:hypothetical protein
MDPCCLRSDALDDELPPPIVPKKFGLRFNPPAIALHYDLLGPDGTVTRRAAGFSCCPLTSAPQPQRSWTQSRTPCRCRRATMSTRSARRSSARTLPTWTPTSFSSRRQGGAERARPLGVPNSMHAPAAPPCEQTARRQADRRQRFQADRQIVPTNRVSLRVASRATRPVCISHFHLSPSCIIAIVKSSVRAPARSPMLPERCRALRAWSGCAAPQRRPPCRGACSASATRRYTWRRYADGLTAHLGHMWRACEKVLGLRRERKTIAVNSRTRTLSGGGLGRAAHEMP